jgi:hypothetical protein
MPIAKSCTYCRVRNQKIEIIQSVGYDRGTETVVHKINNVVKDMVFFNELSILLMHMMNADRQANQKIEVFCRI